MSRGLGGPRPLAKADLTGVRAVFTDVDGTLTTRGLLESATLRALEELRSAGLRVVFVSGRSSAWGEAWMRTLPIDGAIVENGGLYYTRRGARVAKVFAQPGRTRATARRRLLREVAGVIRAVPGARLSSDSAFTEVNVAIDHNEEARLPAAQVDRLEALLGARGVTAVRSSVHVNCWIGRFDKLTMLRRFCRREWRWALRLGERRLLYVGDSYNDAPLFGGVPLSVGVGNVRPILDCLDEKPAYVTRAAAGAGFREVARAVLAASR